MEKMPRLVWTLEDVIQRLDSIAIQVSTITGNIAKLQQQEAAMAVNLDALTAEVARNATVEASVKTLLENLTQMIKDIQTSDPATQAQLDQLVATLAAQDQALADAVTANTPAAP